MSFENVIMYGKVIPDFGANNEETKTKRDAAKDNAVLDGDNPENWAKIKASLKK